MNGARPRIVVVGSINRDLVIRCSHLPLPGQTVTASDLREVSGGKGANQAVAASRAGGMVSMVGRVGDDAFAAPLLQQLTDDKIDVMYVDRSPGSSGIAVVAVEDSGQNSILVVPGANGRVEAADVERARDLIASADAVLLQLEVPLAAVLKSIETASRSDVPVLLNPAPAPQRFDMRLLQVDLICPNQSEAAEIVGHAVEDIESASQAAQTLIAQGAKAAVITLGGDGAIVATAAGYKHIAAFSIQPVDTTAAGDAFAGALAVRLIELSGGRPRRGEAFELDLLAAATQFACAAGGLAASAAGAIPSLPHRAAIDRLVAAALDSAATRKSI